MPETTLPAELSKQREVIISRYGNIESAMSRLSPTNIQKAITTHSIKSIKQAYLTDSITLSMFGKCYTKDSCYALIELWLYELSEFAGAQNKLTPGQMNQLAPMIYSDAYALNFAELGLFFNRIKKGYFGEFYGNVDPIKIMTFLGQFLTERVAVIEKYNDELSQEKKRQDFNECLNTKLTIEQQNDITEIRNNFIKQMKR